MWQFRDKTTAKYYNKEQMAKVIGLHPVTLRNIINGKQNCSKLVAYCITKFIDQEAEIIDYFEFKGE